MNILVVNDDGIKAEGIFHLVQALSEVADVYVCAPDGQRSAKSQSITLGEAVTVREAEFPRAKAAYITSGTPADCTKIGLQFLKEEGIIVDLVYTGINMGSNLGKDTLYSGTVGAAMEAAVDGYKAVAVSVDDHEAKYFDVACRLAVDVIPFVKQSLDANTVLNINVPNLPKEKIKGIKFTSLGNRYYDDKFHMVEKNMYELSGQPAEFKNHHQNLDVTAVYNDYASITPLHFDYTDYGKLEEIKGWMLSI